MTSFSVDIELKGQPEVDKGVRLRLSAAIRLALSTENLPVQKIRVRSESLEVWNSANTGDDRLNV